MKQGIPTKRFTIRGFKIVEGQKLKYETSTFAVNRRAALKYFNGLKSERNALGQPVYLELTMVRWTKITIPSWLLKNHK